MVEEFEREFADSVTQSFVVGVKRHGLPALAFMGRRRHTGDIVDHRVPIRLSPQPKPSHKRDTHRVRRHHDNLYPGSREMRNIRKNCTSIQSGKAVERGSKRSCRHRSSSSLSVQMADIDPIMGSCSEINLL